MTRPLFILALSSMTLGCKPTASPTGDTGDALEDTGDALGDTGDALEDTGDALGDTGEALEDTGLDQSNVERPSAEEFAALQLQALADEIQFFSANADLPIEIVGEHGTVLSLPPPPAPHQLRRGGQRTG